MKSYNRINLGLIIKMRRSEMKLTQEQLAKSIKIGRAAMNAIENGHSVAPLERIIALNSVFGFNLLSNDLITKTENGVSEEEYAALFDNKNCSELGTQIHNFYQSTGTLNKGINLPTGRVLLSIDMIEPHSESDYINYLSGVKKGVKLDRFFFSEKDQQGDYLAYRVIGEAMSNGTSRSIPHRSIVVGKKVKKELWESPAVINQWRYYLVVTQKAVLTREIQEVDVSNKRFLLHTLNDDKEYFPNTSVTFDECLAIYRIVFKQTDVV